MGPSRIRETYLDLGLEIATAVLRLHSKPLVRRSLHRIQGS
jgi:hypothetical protein